MQKIHKTILIHDSNMQDVENIKQRIESGINHFNITILTANTIFDVLEILNKRTDLDLMIVEILEGDNDPVEIELLQKARAEQQAHLRIVIHTQEERIVRSQSGDLAKIIPVRDRFLKGYDDGHFPGTEDFLRSRIRDWLGAL